MKLLIKSAWGSDDPTKACFPFLHANAFAEALTHDLKELGKDGHFRVGFDPDFHAPAAHDPRAAKETTDGGATWHAFTSDYQQAAPVSPAITFGDAQAGYATVRGSIQRTIDGGAHWTSLRTPGTF